MVLVGREGLCGAGGEGGAVWGRWGGRGCVVLVGKEGLCGAGEEERGRENVM